MMNKRTLEQPAFKHRQKSWNGTDVHRQNVTSLSGIFSCVITIFRQCSCHWILLKRSRTSSSKSSHTELAAKQYGYALRKNAPISVFFSESSKNKSVPQGYQIMTNDFNSLPVALLVQSPFIIIVVIIVIIIGWIVISWTKQRNVKCEKMNVRWLRWESLHA